MSESTTEQSSREQEREALRDARYFVELYARRNPRFEHDGEMQDPSGVNACLERIDAVLARPTVLLQDENSGREGRRYNEWHASRPDARLNAREAAASIPPTPITAEEAGREGEAHVPYLCIAPVCGGHCGDCAYAIGPQKQRDYALRYAHLRTMQQSGCGVFEFQGNGEPNPNGILLGGHLDSFVDAELAAMKLPPAPAQSGGQA